MKNYEKMSKTELIQEIARLKKVPAGQDNRAGNSARRFQLGPGDCERLVEDRARELAEARLDTERLRVLESRQATVEELVGNIAHQWRQPLNIIGLTVQKLQFDFERQEVDDAYLNELVREVMQIVKQMSRAVQTFRDFMKADKASGEFNLNEALRNVASFVEDSMKSADVSLRADLCEEEIQISGYCSELCCILLNLLNKSKKVLLAAGITPTLITLRLFREDNRPVITIHDNGGGLPGKAAEKLFDPQATLGKRGTGLEFYLAKLIIEGKMKGSMTAENKDGGVEFRIEL